MILVGGYPESARQVAEALCSPGAVVVTHRIDDVNLGVVVRLSRAADSVAPHREVLSLVNGCVSCTVRADLLPFLRRLAVRGNVSRIVVVLDPAFEPQPVCWAIENVTVAGILGQLDAPAAREVRVAAVLTCIDAATWLADATGDDILADRLPDCDPLAGDDRTVAQVAVSQVADADALIVTGTASDAFEAAKLGAVLARLAPTAAVRRPDTDIEALLASVPYVASRGRFDDAHGPLLRGQPPLEAECGVALVEFTAARPFHPTRLHEALDVLLDGVVTARGRIWLATQPDRALWLESAGGGLRVGHGGTWLVAMTPAERDTVPAERRAMAALRWDDRFGDRDTSLVVLIHAAEPAAIAGALRYALVTDVEFAAPGKWASWADPFGSWHEDPCGATQSPFVELEGEEHS